MRFQFIELVSKYRRFSHLATVLLNPDACRLKIPWHQRHAAETPTQYDRLRAGWVAFPASNKCRYPNDNST